MKSKFLSWVSALSAVALVSGALVVTASAHIGASHTPLFTDGPDLVSATLDGDDVDYCFDEEIGREPTDAGDFFLAGYDSETEAAGDSVDFDDDDENCVQVGFGAAVEREENFTVAGVEEDAVETRTTNDINPQGTVELLGSTATGGEGRTVAPNLVDFDDDEQADEIAYNFDEPIDCESITTGGLDSENFGYYDTNNDTIRQGTTIEECDDENGEVVVGFAGGVLNAERVWVVRPGTNAITATNDDICEEDPITTGSGDGCVNIEGIGGDVNDSPDLTDVTRTDEDEWTYSFDQDVDPAAVTTARFHLYEEDGTEHTANGCTEDEEDTVVCDYTTTEDDAVDGEYPLAAVEHGAVEDDATAEVGTAGSVGVASSLEDGGLTDGPDLERATYDAAGGIVTFFFDEPHDDDVDPAEGDFYVIESDGDTAPGSDIEDVETDDNSIQVEFDEDEIQSAVGAGVDDDAAEDWIGENSIRAAVGGGPAGVPTSPTGGTTTTTTTTTSTSTSTTTTTRTPRRINAPTKLTGRYRRTTFKGSVRSRFGKCEAGRLITVRKGRRVIGRDTSAANGRWSVRKRGAAGRHVAKVSKKVFTRGNGDTIVCSPAKKRIRA